MTSSSPDSARPGSPRPGAHRREPGKPARPAIDRRSTDDTVPVDSAVVRSLHPDCPDWSQLGPTPVDGVLRAAAERQRFDAEAREATWRRGFNRRTLLKGGLGVGVATLGSQVVTSRVSYAAPGETSGGTLVVVFLRGGLDGLSVLVPADDRNLLRARPDIAVRGGSLLRMDRGFGLHPALSPLKPLLDRGRLAAVPAVATPDLSRSHFQAQDCLERGSTTAETSGWLDRVLQASGPGTTFRSVALGGLLPRSLAGTSGSLAMDSLDALELVEDDKAPARTNEALRSLYTGVDHAVSTQALLALDTLDTARTLTKEATASSVGYPEGSFGEALASLATLIKAGSGVRVACIDVGGWDMHTGIGTIDDGDMTRHLGDLADGLAAFTTDLGPHLDSTTVITMSEFGRRLAQNGNGGTDHGHGGLLLAMGGGVDGGVHGRWEGLSEKVLDQGDVPGTNDYRDVLSEIVSRRLDVPLGSLGDVFPGWKPTPVGVMA